VVLKLSDIIFQIVKIDNRVVLKYVNRIEVRNHVIGWKNIFQYQCFRYERHLEDGKIVTKMSQSYRGSCEGLWSAEEGDKTYTLWQGNWPSL